MVMKVHWDGESRAFLFVDGRDLSYPTVPSVGGDPGGGGGGGSEEGYDWSWETTFE